jgi:hypothetical protein
MSQKAVITPTASKLAHRQLLVLLCIQLTIIGVLFFFAASPRL